MTEFGPAEQSRLAELLGDEYERCLSCGGKGHFDVTDYSNGSMRSMQVGCPRCGGTGKDIEIPTGLALIEECRKRGVQISVDTFGDGYAVLSSANWCDGEFRDKGLRYCGYEDLESAIAIAALKGLEAMEKSESSN